MCLAIFKPAKVELPMEHIRNGWIANSDGGGYGFIDKKKMVTRKGIMTLKEFGEAYQKDAKQYSKSPFLVHFRIRSQGDKSADNTHPFPIAGGLLIHNGTLDGTDAQWGTGPSDTALFAKEFGNELTYEWANAHKKEMEEAVGYYNKLAMLWSNGKYLIVNEKAGHWLNDVWYSNFTYRPRLGESGSSCSTGVCQ